MASPELVLHPIRLRIVQAAFDGRPITTAQLRTRLTDVSPATIYRHVALLVEGGVLEVVDEHRIRGAVERTYRLRKDAMELDAAAVAAMTPADHRRSFNTFVAGLLADFDRYLGDRTHVDARADHMTYSQAALWLSDSEIAELYSELRTVITARADNEPRPGRRRYMISVVGLPDTD